MSLDRHNRESVFIGETHNENQEAHNATGVEPAAEDWQSFVDGDATPDVSTGSYWMTANTSATTITNFDNPKSDLHKITILFTEINTTIQNNANIVIQSGVDFTGAVGDTKVFLYDGTNWVEQALDAVHTDGSTVLTADWDIGDGRKILADKIQARDGDGLSLFEDGGTGIFVKDGGNVGFGGQINPVDEIHVTGDIQTDRLGIGVTPDRALVSEVSNPALTSFKITNPASSGWAGVNFTNDLGTSAIFAIGGSTAATFANIGVFNVIQNRPFQIGTNNIARVTVQADGDVIIENNLGIGTDTPDRPVDILHASDPQLRLSQSDGVEFVEFECTSSSQLTINSDGNETLRLTQAGVLSVDLGGSGAAAQVDLFDDYDDPMEIEQLLKQQNLDKMLELGIISRKKDGGYWMNIQPMVRLLGGGIYQLYHKMNALGDEIAKLRANIA